MRCIYCIIYILYQPSGRFDLDSAPASRAGNMKRTFVDYGVPRDWKNPLEGTGLEFLQESVHVKNVWVPMGE